MEHHEGAPWSLGLREIAAGVLVFHLLFTTELAATVVRHATWRDDVLSAIEQTTFIDQRWEMYKSVDGYGHFWEIRATESLQSGRVGRSVDVLRWMREGHWVVEAEHP